MNDAETPIKSFVMADSRPNYICNFRAPDAEHYQIWQDFKKSAQDRGLDVCYVTLTLCEAWLKGVEGSKEVSQVVSPTRIINLQQQNTFVYGVEKPRREPTRLNCAKTQYSRTISSSMAEAYVMEKARDLNRSFSFLDFRELKHDSFRKIVTRLKKRGKIIALPQRTNPRFYVLSERLADYPNVSENNTVKPLFSDGGVLG